MSSRQDLKDFPDVGAKLQRPTKQSAFEKSRAEAEAKRKRDEAETKAALAEFEREFDNPADDAHENAILSYDGAGASHGPGRPAAFTNQPPNRPGPIKRHFGSKALKSGPGSLGPVPGSFGKKRSFQDMAPSQTGPANKTRMAPGTKPGKMSIARAFNNLSDDEDVPMDAAGRARNKAVAKPTLKLDNLPPSFSHSATKALLPSTLVVDNVLIQRDKTALQERRSGIAIVTLSQQTPMSDIDAAVSSLQHKYLGHGYYLSIYRHLSSAVSETPMLITSKAASAGKPFGAKPVETAAGSHNTPRQFGHRGYAPPSSYSTNHGVDHSTLMSVLVTPPENIRTLRLIHQVLEGVSLHGPNFESMVMSRPSVQKHEKWAWIWDPRSKDGAWYRWKFFETVTRPKADRRKYLPLFKDSLAWKKPDKGLPFEFTAGVDQIASDPDYDASEDEGFEEDHEAQREAKARSFLEPLQKTKLAHLLARLPSTNLKVRKGDVARITAFAMSNASHGADEIVDTIVSNVENPYCLSIADARRPQENRDMNKKGGDEQPGIDTADRGAASLVGLYVIHDILSTSTIHTAPRAWRYRHLFEESLRDRKVFAKLGLMPDNLGWGRLRAEKFKRSVQLVLNHWEASDLFPTRGQELFVSAFENHPSSKSEQKTEESRDKTKWKAVERIPRTESDLATGTSQHASASSKVEPEKQPTDQTEGEPEGEPIGEDEVMGEPISMEEILGMPIDESEIYGDDLTPEGHAEEHDIEETPTGEEGNGNNAPTAHAQPRKRMKAVDMFADSNDEFDD